MVLWCASASRCSFESVAFRDLLDVVSPPPVSTLLLYTVLLLGETMEVTSSLRSISLFQPARSPQDLRPVRMPGAQQSQDLFFLLSNERSCSGNRQNNIKLPGRKKLSCDVRGGNPERHADSNTNKLMFFHRRRPHKMTVVTTGEEQETVRACGSMCQ